MNGAPHTRFAWAAIAVVVLCLASAPTGGAQSPGRVFVIGFDGLDFVRVERMIAADRLPRFAELARRGTFRRLVPTTPAQSPVSWSALTTGLNPGRTGIDDFLRRDFSNGDVRAELALVDLATDRSGVNSRTNRRWLLLPLTIGAFATIAMGVRKKRRVLLVGGTLFFVLSWCALWLSEEALPDGRPRLTNARRGEAYWETLDRGGKRSVTLLAPCAFPAPHLDHGKILSGLGVPDLLGTPGFWTLLADDAPAPSVTQTGGRVLPLSYVDPRIGDGPFRALELEGPPDVVKGSGRVRTSLEATRDRLKDRVLLASGGTATAVERGKWSGPIALEFAASPLFTLAGRTRAKYLDRTDVVRVYLEPIGLDPKRLPPGIKMSHPESWAGALVDACGEFETLGWACATNPLKDGAIDDRTFLEDATRVWDEQERLALHAAEKDDYQVFTAIFSVPDRVQHVFSRYDGRVAGPDAPPAEILGAIDAAYERADRFVGMVLDRFAKPEDLVIVCSDHGFAPWKRAVNLNTFLRETGRLVLKMPTGDRSLHDDLGSNHAFAAVDWSKTKAYAMGLGRIYLNRAGREPSGIVGAAEAEALMAALAADLLALRDEGRAVTAKVERGDEIYDGQAIPNGAADLYVSFNPGWRISWAACLGGADEPLFFDNHAAWSGDHCGVDPEQVAGILMASRPLGGDSARVADVAPTILGFFGAKGVELGPRDGRVLGVR